MQRFKVLVERGGQKRFLVQFQLQRKMHVYNIIIKLISFQICIISSYQMFESSGNIKKSCKQDFTIFINYSDKLILCLSPNDDKDIVHSVHTVQNRQAFGFIRNSNSYENTY